MVSTGLYIFVLFLVVFITLLIPRKFIQSNANKIFSLNNVGKFLFVCAIPILIYTFFWGLRDEVGTDYVRYIKWYEDAEVDIMTGGFGEYSFLYLCYGLSLIGFSYVSLFVVTSFINISSVYLSAWNQDKITLALSVYFYFTTTSVFFAQNGIRQAMASSILLIALHLIVNKRYLYWFFAVILAFFTHHSSIVFALFIFFIDRLKPIYIKPVILWVIYVVIEFIGHTLQEALFGGSWSLIIAAILGYENQVANALEELGEAASYSSGLGRYLRIVINTIVIFVGSKFIQSRQKDFAYYAYWVFILGICMHQLFAGNLLLRRLAILFSWLEFPAMAYVGGELWKSRSNLMKLSLFLILVFGSFMFYYAACTIGSNGVKFYKMVNF